MTAPQLLHSAGEYLATPGGTQVYLAGSHTWNQSQQIGPQAFTFDQFSTFEQQTVGANDIRYWIWDQSNEGDGTIPDSQLPFQRSSTPGAYDGGNKWDLTKYNQSFFDNLRANVINAGNKGMYVNLDIFQSEFLNYGYMQTSWNNDPFNGQNNINGVNPGSGSALQNLGNSAVTSAQEAFIAKIINTVHDLPNVLYEVDNEGQDNTATWNWQNAMADYIKNYETSKGYAHHPVGITAPYPNGTAPSNAALFSNTHSDWTSPYGWYDYQSNPPDATEQKPGIVDSDHANSGSGKDGTWIWEMFTRGYSVALMDNMGGSGLNDPLWGNQDTSADIAMLQNARQAIKNTTHMAKLLHLGAKDFGPHDSRSSTGYALGSPSRGEWAVFAPSGGSFTVNLSGYSGTLNKQWVNVNNGAVTAAGTVTAGATRSFTAPDSRDALILTPTSTPLAAPVAAASPRASTNTTSPSAGLSDPPKPGLIAPKSDPPAGPSDPTNWTMAGKFDYHNMPGGGSIGSNVPDLNVHKPSLGSMPHLFHPSAASGLAVDNHHHSA